MKRLDECTVIEYTHTKCTAAMTIRNTGSFTSISCTTQSLTALVRLGINLSVAILVSGTAIAPFRAALVLAQASSIALISVTAATPSSIWVDRDSRSQSAIGTTVIFGEAAPSPVEKMEQVQVQQQLLDILYIYKTKQD